MASEGQLGYVVGIDLGTTYAAAAITPTGSAGETPTMVTLGHRAVAIPSVVFVGQDGTLVVGDQAVEAGAREPGRLASEFKRRFGDTTPLILGGQPYAPQALQATLLRAVLADVESQAGQPPDAVLLTHPANWGPYKLELFAGVAPLAGVRAPVLTLSEPEAAAAWYAQQSRVPDGAAVAVYDLGGGTFDAAILRHDAGPGGQFAIVGHPRGIEHLGGIDIDHTLTTQLLRILGVEGTRYVQTGPPDALVRLVRQRAACVAAKELLSFQTRVEIVNHVTSDPPSLALSRAEFDSLITPLIDQTVTVLSQVIEDSGVAPSELHAVLLVGGTSRIPLVASKLTDALGRPVAVDAHPKNAVALGAAVVARARVRATQPVPDEPVVDRAPPVLVAARTAPLGAAPVSPVRARRWVRPLLVGTLAVLVALGAVAVSALRGGSITLYDDQGADGQLTIGLPKGWILNAQGKWDEPPFSETVPELGPYAMQAHPGEVVVSDLDQDRRPYVFVGVPNPTAGDDLERLLKIQSDYWNADKRCPGPVTLSSDSDRSILRRWSGCTRSDTFVERAWRMDHGRAVYAIARVGKGLSETEAKKVLDSVRLTPA